MNAQVKTTGLGPEPLGLSAVLVGSLPATLLTEEAPDRYTVEAVFTRKTDRDEVAAIQGGQTRAYLSARGFPTVELRVSDRRMEIANTNLEELRDGLATVIADRLAEIDRVLKIERERAMQLHQDASARDRARAASVVVLAESVRFTRRPLHAVPDDMAQISDWVEEGGAVGR